MWPILLLITIFLVSYGLYLYSTRRFNYWKIRGVPHDKPIPVFGNVLDIFIRKSNMGRFYHEVYKETDGPFRGTFICDRPYLMIKDLDLIKTVLIKDFDIFDDRTTAGNKKADPIGSNMLFLLKNPDWKYLRRKLTPIFTSGKLKLMFSLLSKSARDLQQYLHQAVDQDSVVEVRDICSSYTTNAITSIAFGMDANSFKNENSEFRTVSRRIGNFDSVERSFSTLCYFIAPTLVKYLGLRMIDLETSMFLRRAFWDTVHERRTTHSTRNDLIDMLLELRQGETNEDKYKLEDDQLVAQAVQFFAAGFETSGTTMAFVLYELARHQGIQTKLRQELMEIKRNYGQFTYDNLSNAQYLDMCIKETLRIYPILPFLDRQCKTDYKIPNTDIILEKGTPILISVLGLHKDPKYFPDPEVFDPERFTPENEAQRPSLAYMPFGDGPRNCIGSRFAMVSMRCGLAHILAEYKIEMGSKITYPLEMDMRTVIIVPRKGVHLRFSKHIPQKL